MNYKLRDLIEIKNGSDYKKLNKGHVPVYGTGGVMTYVDSYLFDGESVLLPRKGTLDNVMYVNGKFWTVDTMYWTVVNKDKVLPLYLYYYLSLLDMSSRDSGSTLPSMTFDAYYTLDVDIPPLDIQKKVINTIEPIDRKINNNALINDNLFHQALTLYDYWFTQFDFPDNTGKPYKTSGGSMYYCNQLGKSIPLGWNSTTVSKLCVCHDSKRVPLASSERQTMQGNYPYYGATEIMDHIDRYIFDGDYVLLAEDGSIMDKNGHPVLQRISGKSWVNNHAHILEPISGYSCFLLFMLLKDIPVVKIKTGSIQSKITQANLNSYSLIEIPSELREKFISITAPIDKKMLKLKAENESLLKLRSWILPMLMSGQATISD